jgi:tRNA (adenine22-N1)-methyltransferase
MANRQAAGLEARVDLRHGDGLAPLHDEGDALTIAGLGGRLVTRILQAHPAKLARFGQLVLQPNQQAEHVRAWARQAGWHLTDEALVEEGDHFFPVLAFRPGTGPDPAYALPGFTPDELDRLGPRLLATNDPIARRLWRAQRDRLAPLVGQPGTDADAWHRLYERALAFR